MSNFAFTQADFPSLYADALEAEKLTFVSPTAAAILCRSSLENAVNWLYDHDRSLQRPWRADLSTLLQRGRENPHYFVLQRKAPSFVKGGLGRIPMLKYNPNNKTNARKLRANMTDAELT
ncbi:MAG: DUF4145 domain-containing protein [Mariprofundaceae bacterium]|nr:DUF4145 domain-containing protein [Mariprofundaceae bacterium]